MKQKQSPDKMLLCLLPAAPITALSGTMRQGFALCFAFCIITALTALISALVSKKLPLPVRIVLYSVIGSLVYVPAVLLTVTLFPGIGGGIWIPLLSAGLYLTAEHDRFFSRKHLWRRLLQSLVSVTLLTVLCSIFRELLGSGTLLGEQILKSPPLPILTLPAAGLMLLVFLAAGFSYAVGKLRGE